MSGFERRAHPETGELCYVARSWDPPARFGPRRKHGVHGRPHLSLWLFADRAVFERGWCYSSGHMDAYEEEVEATLRPLEGEWPKELGEQVLSWFGPGLRLEVDAILADSSRFEAPDTPG